MLSGSLVCCSFTRSADSSLSAGSTSAGDATGFGSCVGTTTMADALSGSATAAVARSGHRAIQQSPGLAHVIGGLKERPQGLFELLVAAEPLHDLVIDEDRALGPAPQTAAVGLNRLPEPLLAQLRDIELTVLGVRHRDALPER